MIDKIKFHEMTKPMKFRRLKMIKQYAVLWFKALRERIIYLFNYSLYKLHILKRYSYRDNSERECFAFVPPSFEPEVIETEIIRGVVSPRLMIRYNIDVDYFYYEKNGKTIITLSLKDRNESKTFLNTTLTNIFLRVGGVWFNVNSLPRFKVAVLPPSPAPFDDKPHVKVDYNTVTYDTQRLKNLFHRTILSENFDEAEFYNNYKGAVNRFKYKLSNLSLKDLEV